MRPCFYLLQAWLWQWAPHRGPWQKHPKTPSYSQIIQFSYHSTGSLFYSELNTRSPLYPWIWSCSQQRSPHSTDILMLSPTLPQPSSSKQSPSPALHFQISATWFVPKAPEGLWRSQIPVNVSIVCGLVVLSFESHPYQVILILIYRYWVSLAMLRLGIPEPVQEWMPHTILLMHFFSWYIVDAYSFLSWLVIFFIHLLLTLLMENFTAVSTKFMFNMSLFPINHISHVCESCCPKTTGLTISKVRMGGPRLAKVLLVL